MALLPSLETAQQLKLFRPVKKAAQLARFRKRGADRSIIVIGVQRSGTNMIMQAFDHRWDTEVFREADPRAFNQFVMRPLPVIQSLRDKNPAPLFVTKALLDLHRVDELREGLAPVSFIWIYRHYEPMIRSHVRKWQHGEYIEKIVEDPASAGYRGLGMSEETLGQLRKIYRPDLSMQSRTALFWWFRNKLLFEAGIDKSPHSILVNYERIVSAPQASWQIIWNKLGLTPDPRSIRFVHADSRTAPHMPEIADDVRALCDGMWDQLNKSADISAV